MLFRSCLDESGSTFGENAALGMAIALLLLEICRVNKRNFSLIHFSGDIKVDLYLSTDTDITERVFETAETFLNGGTDFVKPLCEAVKLISEEKLQKPDLVFITDGESDNSEEFAKNFSNRKAELKFSVTGILLDREHCFDFSLQKFCDEMFRTSQLCNEDIVNKIIAERI